MDLGADEFRICKKIEAINPDFCQKRSIKSNGGASIVSSIDQNEPDSALLVSTAPPTETRGKQRRGVIYM
eukprot:gene22277-28393_t